MKQPSSPLTFSRPLPWIGAAFTMAALGPLPATAQIISGTVQNGTGLRGGSVVTPSQPVPINTQAPRYLPSPSPVYSQSRSYPQAGGNQFAPTIPFVPPSRVFLPGPSGSGTQVFGPPQTLPGHIWSSISDPSQTRLPGVIDRTLTGPGGSGRREDAGQPAQRFYSNQLLRPVTPGRPQPPSGAIHVTTSIGQRSQSYGNNYIYAPVTVVGGPSLLGGYYYGNYSNTYYAEGPCYPSVYSTYPGFPEYIINPGVIVVGDPYYPSYVTPPQPFYAPVYQVTYNQNNYYAASQDGAQQIQDGGQTATRALKSAYPEDSYQAAFGDIQMGWKNGDIDLIRKHIRDSDTTLSVYFKGKYSYSIASGDFVKITRDAFDRLSTVSFEFTRLRKVKNGDVTAYGRHVYQSSGSSESSDGGTDNTVPFSADGVPAGSAAQPYGKADDPAAGTEKTAYVSYTLRRHDDQWSIIGVDSSPTALLK